MNILLATLGDSIWQIGGGIMLLAVLLLLALRSPEVHFSPWHQWLWTWIALLVCLSLFLVLNAGVVLLHGANAAPIGAPVPSSTAVSSPGGLSPSPTPVPSSAPSLSPSPSPAPIPSLTPSTAQVLTTFCDAIDRHDLDTAWGQYAKSLQKERATPPPFLVRITLFTVG